MSPWLFSVYMDGLMKEVLMYGSETMLWKDMERSRSRAVQMDNLRRLLGIRRMDGSRIHG